MAEFYANGRIARMHQIMWVKNKLNSENIFMLLEENLNI